MKLFFGFLDLKSFLVGGEEVKEGPLRIDLEWSVWKWEGTANQFSQVTHEAVFWVQEMGEGWKRRSWEAPDLKFYFQ